MTNSLGILGHGIWVEFPLVSTSECSCLSTSNDSHSTESNTESRRIELQISVSDIFVGLLHNKLYITASRIFDKPSIFVIVQLFVDQT